VEPVTRIRGEVKEATFHLFLSTPKRGKEKAG
jgi:hypothetical protein